MADKDQLENLIIWKQIKCLSFCKGMHDLMADSELNEFRGKMRPVQIDVKISSTTKLNIWETELVNLCMKATWNCKSDLIYNGLIRMNGTSKEEEEWDGNQNKSIIHGS